MLNVYYLIYNHILLLNIPIQCFFYHYLIQYPGFCVRSLLRVRTLSGIGKTVV